MTPFDPVALLAMLLAFYQPATPANLARAMRERPEYFATGVPIGHSGDAMRLPDGRVFDLIFSVGGANARYQVLYKPEGGADVADPFPLEDGPLAPIDPATFIVPLERISFTALVGAAFDELPGRRAQLELARTTIAEHSVSTRIEAASALYLDPAEAAHVASAAAFHDADPSSLIAATAGQDGALGANRSDFEDPDPGNFVGIDPGPIPPQGPTQPPEQD